MATAVTTPSTSVHEKLNKSPGKVGLALFGPALVIGFGYAAMHLVSDLSARRTCSHRVLAARMAANHSGPGWGSVRSLAMAWVLTLPASILLASTLFWLF